MFSAKTKETFYENALRREKKSFEITTDENMESNS